jgi:hypothetical protein
MEEIPCPGEYLRKDKPPGIAFEITDSLPAVWDHPKGIASDHR